MATDPDNGDDSADWSEDSDAPDTSDDSDYRSDTDVSEPSDDADTPETTSGGETVYASGDTHVDDTSVGPRTDDAGTDAGMAERVTERAAPVDYEVSDEEQTWGVLVHASALSAMFVPFGNILGPLLIWLVKRDESRFVDENGMEALNFQITWTILFVVSLVTMVIGIGLVLAPLVAVAWLVLVVVATLRASERQVYDYPLTIDFVS